MKYKLDENRIKEGVGGQAVIEGIMLRNKTHYVVAVRKPNKIIDFIKYSIPENKNKLSKMIFFRGIINFVDMMKLGYKTLMFSANTAGLEEEVENKSKTEKEENNEKKTKYGYDFKHVSFFSFCSRTFCSASIFYSKSYRYRGKKPCYFF